MEAILASPSAFSPPLSPTNSSPGSPLLPALSSPFSLGSLNSNSPQATPSRSNSLKKVSVQEERATPSWMTDELEEEWVEEEPEADELEEFDNGDSNNSRLSTASTPKRSLYGTHRSSPFGSVKSLSSRPRVPSSLRFALQPSASPSRNSLHAPRSPVRPSTSPREGSENISPDSSSAGTFIARSDGSSYRHRGGQGEDQLAAAVRAMKGPSGGLGAAEIEEGEVDLAKEKGNKSPTKGRKGLSSLFEPPSPPTAKAVVPVSNDFTFEAPRVTPAKMDTSALIDLNTPDSQSATPLGRPQVQGLGMGHIDSSTPARAVSIRAPSIQVRDRYLHRPNAPTAAVATPAAEEPPRVLGPSPALVALPATPVPPTPEGLQFEDESNASEGATPAPMKTFTFNYDTYTRHQLAALVDELDEQVSPPHSRSRQLDLVQEEDEDTGGWDGSFVSATQGLTPHRGGGLESEDELVRDDLSDESVSESVRRASKRIRLSPPRLPEIESESEAEEPPVRRRTSPRSHRRVSAGGFRTALGASVSRRRGVAASSPEVSPTSMRNSTAQAMARHSRGDSLASAHGLGDSTREVSALLQQKPVRSAEERKAAAAELMDRLRSKMASPSLTSSPSVHDTTILARSTPFSNASTVKPPPQTDSTIVRFRTDQLSPRKLLRRLSGADQVDAELRDSVTRELSASVALRATFEDESMESADSHVEQDEPPPLPRLAALASASIRDALSNSTTPSATPSRKPFARQSMRDAADARQRSRVWLEPARQLSASAMPAPQPREANGHARSMSVQDSSSQAELAAGVSAAFSRSNGLHARHASLTTISPAEGATLLAQSAPSSKLVFSASQNRWVKPSSIARSAQIAALEEELASSGSIDPFAELDLTRQTEPEYETSQADLSNRLRQSQSQAADMSGLGIMSGTPGTPAPKESPEDACYFEPPPREELESEVEADSAEWTQANGFTDQLEEARLAFERAREQELSMSENEFEESMELVTKSLDGASIHETEDHTGPTGTQPDEEPSPMQLYEALAYDHAQRETASASPTQELEPAYIGRASLRASPRAASPPRIVALPSAQQLVSPVNERVAPNENLFTPRAAPTAPRAVSMPRSALKQPARSNSDEPEYYTSTPNGGVPSSGQKPPRSVSFSDGKRAGPIEGLRETEVGGSRLKFEMSTNSRSTEGEQSSLEGEISGAPGPLEISEGEAEQEVGGAVTSVRSKRIEDALANLVLSQPRSEAPSQADFSTGSVVISTFESAPRVRPRTSSSPNNTRSFRRTTSNNGDGTFLTECSWGVSHDKLVKYITDVQPFERDWADVTRIDLSEKGAESLVRLKDLLPNLDSVNLSNNALTYLTGVPSKVRSLLIPGNRLTSLASFGHLTRLETLDLSGNQLDSVRQLEGLHHLRELKADFNAIEDISGLAKLDGLIRLSLKGNKLTNVDFDQTNWTRLESVNLSKNSISSVVGLERLSGASLINLDHNALSFLACSRSLRKLRVLKLSANPITELDVSFAPDLRTLFVDSARLGGLSGTGDLRKLENLSVRDQAGEGLQMELRALQDAKRLYFSGNPLPAQFGEVKLFNLTYLELALCQITHLPNNLAQVVPNVRVINLDYNFIEDLSPLHGLERLRKLTLVGGRVAKGRKVVKLVESLPELEELDLRSNPLTLPFYPPAHPKGSHAPHEDYALTSSDTPAPVAGGEWTSLDKKFRRALPDEWYFKRTAYRMALITAGTDVLRLDGLNVGGEREKVAGIWEGIRKKREGGLVEEV